MRTAGLYFLATMAAFPAWAASFDCRKAASPDEQALCADPQLSALDSLMGTAYSQLRTGRDPADIQSRARAFLQQRRGCGVNGGCLFSAYDAILTDYRSLGAAIPMPGWMAQAAATLHALPVAIDQCIDTRVTQILPRLSGMSFDTGVSIVYANGGAQTTYDADRNLIQSRPGDTVTLCLRSLPHDCPPGDNRGRVYSGTNLRTHGHWALADSEHLCGGA